MKYTLLVMAFTFILFSSCSKKVAQEGDSSGVVFTSLSFDEAKAVAAKNDKLIFMDAYADWCGPCKMLSKRTFPDKELGAFFNKNYVNIKLDVDQPEGKKIAREYEVNGIPALFFLKADGSVVKKAVGFLNADQLLDMAKKIEQ